MSRRQLREQCRDCGKLFGTSLAHALATAGTPELNLVAARAAAENEQAERERRWQEGRRRWDEECAERRQLWEREGAEASEEWWSKYNAYLNTEEWRRRRELVFDRAGGLCEGCRKQTASQVHHLTYDHVTDEFLWELVAICDECHRRVHSK
jgi:5-methylcytosine-specific restriction endonuclease McrA